MKGKKLLSWALSLVMALMVFSIPIGGAVYAEGGDDQLQLVKFDWNEDTETSTETPLTSGAEYSYDQLANSDNMKYASAEISICTYNSEDDEYYQIGDASKIQWTNSNPSAAGIEYTVDDEDDEDGVKVSFENEVWVYESGEDEEYRGANPSIRVVPRAATTEPIVFTATVYNDSDQVIATLTLKVTIAEANLPVYQLMGVAGHYDPVAEEYTEVCTPYGDEVEYSAMIPSEDSVYPNMTLCADLYGDFGSYGEAQKLIWKNESKTEDGRKIAAIQYYDPDTEELALSSEDSLTLYPGQDEDSSGVDPYFSFVPLADGTAELSLYIYDDANATDPIATATLKVTGITANDANAAKFQPYLEWWDHIAYNADVDDKEVWGELPEFDDYNSEFSNEAPEITPADYAYLKNNIVIKAHIKDQVKTAVFDDDYVFIIKFSKVALGTPVEVTYEIPGYTKTETGLVVSKYINPKVTAKNYVYDGKKHTAVLTVKYGSTPLKKNKDYAVESSTIVNVGKGNYEMWDYDVGCKYRFYKEGIFKINPKGTSLTKLQKAKKAITVKWKKQAAKMSKTRITGYQIQLATNNTFTKNKKQVNVKGYGTVSKKVKSLKKKTKYFVRVRTYKTVSGKNYYSPWSKVMSTKTK